MLRAACLCLAAAAISFLAGWNVLAVGSACLAQICFVSFLVSGSVEPFRRPVRREHHHPHLLPAR
ncbi:MAG TPA: hypothetical protein VIM58_12875 [Candidatus Methylacidiphilales bacterium]